MTDHTVGFVTDSSSQIPDELVDRYGIGVAPITVSVDGTEYHEGIDLDADGFFELVAAAGGEMPEISTSQPSPGVFLELYDQQRANGAEQIVSIHVGADYSGTVDSARLAAREVDADVLVIDTATASFGVAACVWEAAEAARTGADFAEISLIAQQLVPHLNSISLLAGLDYVRAGGRLGDLELPAEGAPVFATHGADFETVGSGTDFDELRELLIAPFAQAAEHGDRFRAAVCLADPATLPYTEAIETALAAMDHITDVVRYRLGPSIAAHTGPGTAGGFYWPQTA